MRAVTVSNPVVLIAKSCISFLFCYLHTMMVRLDYLPFKYVRIIFPYIHGGMATYQFCKIALRCVFIFVPIYYHTTAYFSIKMWQSASYSEPPHFPFLHSLTLCQHHVYTLYKKF